MHHGQTALALWVFLALLHTAARAEEPLHYVNGRSGG